MAERFGRYWLHQKIGHGGMAEIFRATIGPDPETYAFDLALKRLHSHLENDQSQVDMFLTEADVAKFLRHPNLVRVYEAGLQAGLAYITMEYVWGHDLSRLITILAGRQLRFPSDLAVYTALQLLRALDYVHRARSPGGVPMDLVHRDVTPANVYVTLFGEVKLGDFGVARISFLESPDDTGLLKGKAAYMPPEVLAGEPVDQGVDLWGIAVILYEMLTARRVYEGVSEAELMTGVEPPPITAVEKVNPDVDPKLARIVNRALSPRVKNRPVDALQFYQQLKLYLRDTGVGVDAQAMSRYVAEITGSAPSGNKSAVDDSSFGLPEYKVPMGASPTQRFEQRDRQRARARPVLAVGGLLVVAAIVFGVYRFTRRPDPVEPVAAETVTEAPSESPSETPEDGAPADDGVGFDLADLDPEGIEVGEQGDTLAHIGDPAARLRALLHRGRVQLKRGRAQSSLAAYRAASELKSENVPARLGQANALLALARYDDAERQVNAVLERKPKHANAFVVLGDIMTARGDAAQARWAYERCLKVAPEDSRAARAAKKALSKL